MKKLHLILLISFLSTPLLEAQTNVVHVVDGAMLPANHIMYFLPKTEIVIQVSSKKHIQRAGRFANYAKRLLELNDVVAVDQSFYTLEDIKVYERQIPDSLKQYAVEINSKTIAYKIKTNSLGIIQSINIDNDRLQQSINTPLSESIDTAIYFDYSALSDEVLGATTEEKMAELAAKQILSLRESRMELLSGDTERNYDGASLQQLLSRLEATERTLTELFTGKTIHIIESKTIKLSPSEAIDNEVFARFSQTFGIVDADNYAGQPLYITVKPIETPKNNVSTEKTKRFGIYYNVAGRAEIEISTIDKVLINSEMTMPQFGYTAFLPAKIFNNPTTAVEFTDYGTIKAIK